MGYNPSPFGTGFKLLATTGAAGYALINGTGNVITWTAPNDGALHRVTVFSSINVTSPETGGLIQVQWQPPTGTAQFSQLYAAGLGSGTASAPAPYNLIVAAGQLVAVEQNSALTLGAATLWAEIWGS